MAQQRAVVLGAGMVGSVMAADLASDAGFDVAVADRRPDALAAAQKRAGGKLRTIEADLGDPASVGKLAGEHDIVLGAVASVIGLSVLRAVIEAGRPYCDITFMPEDARQLDELARAKGVTAVVDCGVAPGMSNLLVAHGMTKLEATERIDIYVGGLPRERRWPFEYKAGFAPYDVVEEYTRPARLVEHGQIVIREALSEPELLEFDGIGTLESFNTDGLRSLADTLDVPFMREKTLRYPGHIELMRVFRETGLFSHEPIDAGGVRVRPIDVISALMFPKWTYEEGEADLTVMRIEVTGTRAGERTCLTWDLLDFYDPASRATSMSRTTAFPCVIAARMIADGSYAEPGVVPPEFMGRNPALVERMLAEHEARGVVYGAREARATE